MLVRKTRYKIYYLFELTPWLTLFWYTWVVLKSYITIYFFFIWRRKGVWRQTHLGFTYSTVLSTNWSNFTSRVENVEEVHFRGKQVPVHFWPYQLDIWETETRIGRERLHYFLKYKNCKPLIEIFFSRFLKNNFIWPASGWPDILNFAPFLINGGVGCSTGISVPPT